MSRVACAVVGLDPGTNSGTSSSGITTIASGSLSGGSVTITSIPATYTQLVLFLNNAEPNTGSQTVLVQASTNNGSSYDSSSSNYTGYYITATNPTHVSTASLMPSASLGVSGGTLSGSIIISGYQGGPHAIAQGQYAAGSNVVACQVRYRSTSAINALRIMPSSGNWGGGTYALYGVS